MIVGKSDLLRIIEKQRLVIDPFESSSVRCNGVDLSISERIVRLENDNEILDTHNNHIDRYYSTEQSPSFVIFPNEHMLACTHERIILPNDIVGLVTLRSTYTRLGLSAPCGMVEAGFNGQLTLEIIGGSFPVRIYAGDRVFHIIFMELTGDHKATYRGKYQNQAGVTLPILDSER